MKLSPILLLVTPIASLCALTFASAQQPSERDPAVARALRHATVEWETVAQHLPDPRTASPAQLVVAGDVLRARRLPEDAIDYFHYAIERGGDEAELQNRIGVTELEMNQPALARPCFKRSILLRRKYAEGWNNLGATENMAGNMQAAIEDYGKAVKLNRKNAVFHANLGTAYFASKDYEDSRKQLEIAAKLDPEVFRQGGFGGSQVHVLSGIDRGRFAFEMARLAALTGDDASTMHWLAAASEAGFNIHSEMQGLKEFERYQKDPRVALLIHNQNLMQTKQVALSGPVPTLDTPDSKLN